MIDVLVERYKDAKIDSIGGFDARGFVLGPPLALALKKPFFMLRKPGKMPNSISSGSYKVEYGDRGGMCIPRGHPLHASDPLKKSTMVKEGDSELLVDDLLVYQGQLRPADADVAVGTASASSAGPQWQSILFTDEPELLRREAVRVHHTRAGEEHVLLINSGQVVNQALPPSQRHASITAKAAAEARPSTAVPRSQ